MGIVEYVAGKSRVEIEQDFREVVDVFEGNPHWENDDSPLDYFLPAISRKLDNDSEWFEDRPGNTLYYRDGRLNVQVRTPGKDDIVMDAIFTVPNPDSRYVEDELEEALDKWGKESTSEYFETNHPIARRWSHKSEPVGYLQVPFEYDEAELERAVESVEELSDELEKLSS